MATSDARFHFNNQDSGGYLNIIVLSITQTSTLAGKQEVVPLLHALPEMPMHPVATMVRSWRPIWYRSREDITMTEIPQPPEGWDRDEAWRPPHDTWGIHVCRAEGPGNCGHTPDDPCHWRRNWQRGMIGFAAEEVEQVLPALTSLDKNLKPDGVNLGSLIGLAYAMLQELDTRLNALEAA